MFNNFFLEFHVAFQILSVNYICKAYYTKFKFLKVGEYMKKIGEMIKEYRTTNDLTLRDFANLCGLSHSYISLLEKGIDPRNNKPVIPTLETVERISRAMGISTQEILKEIGFIGTVESENDVIPSSNKPALSIKEQEKLDKEAEEMISNLRMSLSQNKGYLDDKDYAVIEATVRSLLEAMTLKNKEKYTSNKYKNKQE